MRCCSRRVLRLRGLVDGGRHVVCVELGAELTGDAQDVVRRVLLHAVSKVM